MDSINDKENSLFEKWRNNPSFSKSFVKDGVVNPEEWEKQDCHILFLLKEANGENWNGDLRCFLKDGAQSYTWNNITRWTCGILCHKDLSNSYIDEATRIKWLNKVAVVNVKKAGGTVSTNTKQLRNFYSSSGSQELLSKQLSLYDQLDYIICCGDGVKECLCLALKSEILKNRWASYKGIWLKEQCTEILIPMSSLQAPAIINYYHPQCRKSSQYLYQTLMQVVSKVEDMKCSRNNH